MVEDFSSFKVDAALNQKAQGGESYPQDRSATTKGSGRLMYDGTMEREASRRQWIRIARKETDRHLEMDSKEARNSQGLNE